MLEANIWPTRRRASKSSSTAARTAAAAPRDARRSAMATVEPLLKPFETSAPPASYDALDATLRAFMAKTVPIESDGELRRRERVMGELKRLFQAWVRSVCKAKGLSDELASEAGGKLYTSGSYRLRVHEPGADIDSICVAPNHCTREDFFDTLKAMLLEHPQVENLRSVETAVVPIMTFDLDGVNIDLLFAHLPLNAIPASLDIDEDAVLQGVDEATEKSLNGPRVTNRAAKESDIPNFKGSYLGRFPLVSADFWTSDHLSEGLEAWMLSSERARAKHSR